LRGVHTGWTRACHALGSQAQDEARSGMDAVAILLALATFALMFGLIRAMDRM
jgi:hypothetical protein